MTKLWITLLLLMAVTLAIWAVQEWWERRKG
jgi:hypothetical protein